MSKITSIPVVFDVLGTCFSFQNAVDALQSQFAEELKAKGLNATSLVDDWFHSAQRDFTYRSMNGAYMPIAQILRLSLPRVLSMSGLLPSSIASASSTSDSLSPIFATIPSLSPRPSLSACSDLFSAPKLEGKFRLMGATNGGKDATRGLFVKSLGEDKGGEGVWEVFSCDEAQVAKPAPAVYEAIWNRLGYTAASGKKREGWFVASHTWDLFAAKKAGFKTAWVSYEEHLVLEDLYGKPDIVAEDLEEAAKKIIEWEGKS